MRRVGKYEFDSKEQFDAKLRALGVATDEEGIEYPTHKNSAVRLGHIVLTKGEYDEEGNEVVAPILSDKYHVDVAWYGINDTYDEEGNFVPAKHPYGWSSYAIELTDNGSHSFYGLDYLSYKI
jgi:hypothetical protein